MNGFFGLGLGRSDARRTSVPTESLPNALDDISRRGAAAYPGKGRQGAFDERRRVRTVSGGPHGVPPYERRNVDKLTEESGKDMLEPA